MNILADATLPDTATWFKEPFTLTLYDHNDHVASLLPGHDILLCRSTLRVTENLLKNTTIRCVATASSGTDHIDVTYLKKHHIDLIDAKGSNSRAVADYVVASIAYLQQNGQLSGLQAGVVGVGKVGSHVVNRLHAAGFSVIYFDPLRASQDPHFVSCELNELTTCDLICIHANLHETKPYPSKHLFDSALLQRLKTDAVIINSSRGDIVHEDDLLNTSRAIIYCTDVYSHEPDIDPRIVQFSTLCTPHIAGHSIEAKQAAVIQVSEALHKRYGVAMPYHVLRQHQGDLILSNKVSWQKTVLDCYSPCDDTQILKEAIDKKQAYLMQRKAHQNRHDFNVHDSSQLNEQTRMMLGYLVCQK
ncbi:MAG: NAD(P)-dependent oxidoreductase [Legionellaceae bacterium]|nr:NAD(P)-dependent oxidoreductase [Legionellaceae bacterium]